MSIKHDDLSLDLISLQEYLANHDKVSASIQRAMASAVIAWCARDLGQPAGRLTALEINAVGVAAARAALACLDSILIPQFAGQSPKGLGLYSTEINLWADDQQEDS